MLLVDTSTKEPALINGKGGDSGEPVANAHPLSSYEGARLGVQRIRLLANDASLEPLCSSASEVKKV